VSVKHEVLQTPSTIRSLTYDEKGRLIGIFKIDYGTAQGKKRYELFEKIASPWIPVDSNSSGGIHGFLFYGWRSWRLARI
jgi:hypothetical protein